MRKENMASIGEVKSTVSGLEISPSKNATGTSPKAGPAGKGGKAGASGGSPTFKKGK